MEAIKNFDIIINALDNLEARRHVNRLCLSANVPLIEAGSTGMSGQCTSIFPKKRNALSVYQKPTQKQYPVCTIRSTPDKPVHTIIWAKFLWDSLFGPLENEN
jgi:ubiquitin-like 1-activating enzyme E1 B